MGRLIEGKVWLVIAKRRKWSGYDAGDLYVRRTSTRKPKVLADEIAVRVTSSIDSEAFAPLLEATIVINASDVAHAVTMEATSG